MTKHRIEFWLDDTDPEQKYILDIVDTMKSYRFFALSTRYGLKFFAELQDLIAKKSGKFDRNIKYTIAPEEAAQIVYNAVFNPNQHPKSSSHLEQALEKSTTTDEINFDEIDLTKTSGDNLDTMLDSGSDFFDF